MFAVLCVCSHTHLLSIFFLSKNKIPQCLLGSNCPTPTECRLCVLPPFQETLFIRSLLCHCSTAKEVGLWPMANQADSPLGPRMLSRVTLRCNTDCQVPPVLVPVLLPGCFWTPYFHELPDNFPISFLFCLDLVLWQPKPRMTPFPGIILILYNKQHDEESSQQETKNLTFWCLPLPPCKTSLLSEWAERRTASIGTFQ